MTNREKALEAHMALLNGSGKLAYFESRGIEGETVEKAWVGYDSERKAFTYPCLAKGRLLGLHYKGERRNEKEKRAQWWDGYADDLPPRGHGKRPHDPAKVIPFGLETLEDLESGTTVLLCCGEEDALSLRQKGYTALSQPGAGLLEPAYAREFAGLSVVVFYDAGEEEEARKDAATLQASGVAEVRVVRWPPEAPHGTDINGRLVDNHDDFQEWAASMIEVAPSFSATPTEVATRAGKPDKYGGANQTSKVSPPWPELANEALHGLPGDIVRTIEPHTEADRVAVLANLLVAFGNAIGHETYFQVGPDRHHLNLNAALVGETAKGRKGTSWGPVRELMHAIDSPWVQEQVLNGLSSGEGLIYAVRDPRKCLKDGETVVLDPGAEDKRLMVVEGEFAGVLKVMSRDGNTLSPIIRQAWDGTKLHTLTRNSPLKATSAHVSIIGHITKAELKRHLSDTDTENGFANRFLWLLVKRSKVLPFGGEWHDVKVAPLTKRLRSALEFAKETGKITWGESAKQAWVEAYGPLSEGDFGLYGAATSRAEAQVVRLAALYAVIDESPTVELAHLEAALALWQYAADSARHIFGDATGDPVADRIEAHLKDASNGLTRTEISGLFGRNMKASRISEALGFLRKLGHAYCQRNSSEGRPIERWYAGDGRTK